jgi:photosystem II stability/assembly factor-like uncharacterized protein
MTRPHRLFVGTIGEGVFRSLDGGETFRRACDGMFVECHVRALAVHPGDGTTLYLGSEKGVFVSTDGADNWTRLPAPLDGMQVWSLFICPRRPELLLAGTCPSRIFRSDDAGKSWTEAKAQMLQECPRIMHTRVTCITGDAENTDRLWAGVEIDGLYQSEDAGRTWRPIGSGLSSRDIHALAVVPTAPGGSRRLLAATNNDLNRSTDDGVTWQPLNIGKALPWSYCRALAQVPGRPREVLLGQGDGPPGWIGAVARSDDGGDTWQVAAMPGQANSTLWNFAVHHADPTLIYAASVSGEVYRSTDAGARWEKLAREFGEIRALAWTPA